MNPTLVILSYSIAAILAFGALYFFHSRRWYWHAAAVVVALAIGLKPIPAEWNTPQMDVAIGAVLVFLVLWEFSPRYSGTTTADITSRRNLPNYFYFHWRELTSA